MADAAVMPPPGGSLIGRSIKAVLWSGVYGTVGSGIGGLINGAKGKALGLSIGAGGAIAGFGVAKGVSDKKSWNHYQWERFQHFEETGEILPDLQRGRHWWKRRLKNLVGAGLVGGGLVLAGAGPAATAVTALAFWGAVMGASYLVTKLVYRPRRPPKLDDIEGLGGPDGGGGPPDRPVNSPFQGGIEKTVIRQERRPTPTREEAPYQGMPPLVEPYHSHPRR